MSDAPTDVPALEKYGRHLDTCPRWLIDKTADKAKAVAILRMFRLPEICLCGFDAALRAARARPLDTR